MTDHAQRELDAPLHVSTSIFHCAPAVTRPPGQQAGRRSFVIAGVLYGGKRCRLNEIIFREGKFDGNPDIWESNHVIYKG
jgi:hypothetical protein